MYCCSALLWRCLSWHGYLLLCSKIGSSHTSDLAVVNVLLAHCCPLMHPMLRGTVWWKRTLDLDCLSAISLKLHIPVFSQLWMSMENSVNAATKSMFSVNGKFLTFCSRTNSEPSQLLVILCSPESTSRILYMKPIDFSVFSPPFL